MKGLEAKTLGLRKMLRHEYKRIVAFMLTVAMVVTNFGTNLTVAFAAGEEESSLFLLNSSELEDAISAALESGDVFDFSSLELKAKQKSLKTSYEKLIGSKAGKVYQLDVDIDSSYATEHTDLQVFYNAGTDDVVFLFINESDMAVTFRANVSGYETARVTVNPNTTNIEDAEGVENAEDYSGTTMVDDEKKPQAEVVKPEGETSESESASDETEAAETEADVTESENASENGEAEETTGAEKAAETETSEAAETEAETEPETEAEAPAADEAEKEIELTPEEGSASASISAKKVFRVSTSAEAAVEAPAADAEEETEAEEPEKETEAPVETTAEETVADDSTEETIADETQADETTAADETDGELTDETEAPTEDVTTPDETNGEEPADNDGSENIGFDNDEQFLEDDSIELAGELNGKAYNTVTIWGSANARAYVVKAEDLTGEAAVEGQYSVDYSVDPVGAATIKGAHTVNEGETLYFAVDPQVGYEITEVTANGEPLEEADVADVASASDLEQHEHVYAVDAVTEDLEIVASLEETVGVAHPEFSAFYVSSEGVTISLHAEEGILPEGTELSVTEVTDALGDTIKEKMDSETEGTTVHSVLAYDINLLYNGKKLSNSWSESGYVDVTFTGAPIQEMTEASDKVEIVAVDDTSKTQLSAENAAEAEAGELKLETVSEQNVEDAAVEEVGFKAEHFTIYAVAASSGVMVIANGTLNVAKTSMKVGQTQSVTTPLVNDICDEYEWYSDNTNVVQISNKKKKTAQIKAITAGTATITYKYCVNSNWLLWHSHDMSGNNKVTITVTADPITGVTLTGEDTVKAFDSIKLTAVTEPVGSVASSLEWESSNTAILTVDNTGNVTGVAPGTAIVTVHATSSVDSSVYTATKTIEVIPATNSTDRALFYYLKTPTSDPKSNETNQWGECIGTGTITVTGGTWVDSGKNMYSPTHRVLTWPDGSTGSTWTIDKNEYGSHWDAIFNAYKRSVESKYNGVTLTKDDIQSITLIPYKISRNNSSNPDKHVDCQVRIVVKDFYNAIYYVEDAGETGFQSVQQSGPYRSGDTTEPTATTMAAYPDTKVKNGVTYTFVGWYDNEQFTGNVISFPYAMRANKEFYAKYVAGYNVNYDLDGGSWNIPNTYFKNAGSNVYVVGTTPTKTGYDFNGWDRQDDDSHVYVANEKFRMPDNNVTFTAKWTPKEVSYTVNYLLNGTSEKVQDPDTKTGTWGTKVTENAPDISGYTHVATDDATKTHIVGTAPDEINFYYYKNVTLQANSETYTYDGTEKSVSGYIRTDTNDSLTITGVTAGASGTNAGEYTAEFAVDPVGRLIDAQHIVTAALPGKLIIKPIDDLVTVTIVGKKEFKPYNGSEQTTTGYNVTNIEGGNGKYTAEDVALVTPGSDTATGMDARAIAYPMGLTPESFHNINSNFTNVQFSVTDGELTITKRNVVLTSAAASKSYDGTPLTNSEVTVTGDGFVDGEGADYHVTGSQTVVGSSDNTFAEPAYTLHDNTKAKNYNITTQEGTLTVTANDSEVVVTIKEHGDIVTYDGTAHTVSGYDVVSISNELYHENDFTFVGDTAHQTVSGTNAGTYDMALSASDFRNDNANFSRVTFVIQDNTLKIDKKLLKLTSPSANKIYDGNALTATNLTIDGLVAADADKLTYKVTGTQTAVGKSNNTFNFTLDPSVKNNYDVQTQMGELEVTPVTNEIVVKITGNKTSEKYDGTVKTAEGYTYVVECAGEDAGSLYSAADFTFNGNAKVTENNAGEYPMGLDASQFTNKDNNTFPNVRFVLVSDGNLTITKRKVTLNSGSDEKVYDGTPLTNSEITVGGDGFANGEGATYKVTGTQTTAGTSDNTFAYTLNAGTNADNYEISKHEGKLTVTATEAEVVVTITEQSGSFLYDGTEHTVAGYTVTNISNPLYHEADFTFLGNAEVKATDAGTYDMKLKEADFHNTNASFRKVTFVIVDGNLTIEKRKVTLASAAASKVYDGDALTAKTVTVIAGDGFAEGEGATYQVTGSQTEVGTSDNTFTYNLNGNTKLKNYDIESVYGKLKVTQVTEKITVTIKGHSDTVKYNGDEHSVTGYDVTIPAGSLYMEKDITFSGKAEAKGTDADTYNMGLKAENFANSNDNFANVEFVVEEDGKLTITKRDVTLTSAGDEKVYDGTALTNGNVTESGDGFAKNEGATYDVTGTITNVGTKPNTFTYTLNEGTKADNYNITRKEGSLEIKPITDEVVVTITEHSNSDKYDGQEHKAEGYDVTEISNGLYHESDFSFTGDASHKIVTGIDADTYHMGLESTDFTNNSSNFKNVRFVIVDGTLTITKRNVTLTSATDSKTYDGTPLTNSNVTVGGDGFANGEGATYEVNGTQTTAGTSDNTFTYTLNDGTKEKNYEITQNAGTLTVSPSASEIIVTITGHTGSKTYDGTEITVTGYDVSISNPAYTEGDFSFKGNNTLSKTDAGTYSMGLKASDFANTNGNYSNVIFNVTDGSLVIAKRQVTLTSATDQKTYNGLALTNDSVAVSGDGFADGEGASYEVTGSQTNVGNSENTFTYTLNDGTKAENYEIDTVEGTLTVDPREITITANEASKYVGEADPEDYISTPGVVTRIMRWIRPAAAFGATVTSGEVVAGDKLAFKVTRPGAGTDEARGTYKDAVTVTETDAAANANYKITWIPADFHIYEDGLKVEKTVKAPTAPKTVFELGDVIEFNIKVTNTGNTDLKDVIVKDELDGATIVANTGEYTVNADGTATIAVLAAGASVDVKATYTVKAADLGNTSFTNKATATAKTENPKNPDGKVTGEDETDPIAIDSRTTGGGNSGGGGGGGSSSGPRDNGSTPSGGPGTTTVTIDPDAVPLANLPNEDGADNLLMIDDEDVPLAALPKTGQSGTNGLVFFLSSMMLAAFVAVTKKREDDK